MKAKESRPAGNGAASQGVSAGDLNGTSIMPQAHDIGVLAQRRDFYVRVYSVRRDGVVAVQVFADLRSAERKLDRVRANGLAARMELIRVLAVMPLDDRAVV